MKIFLKIVVGLLYMALTLYGLYELCSALAPLPALERYMDFGWLHQKLLSQNKTYGAVLDLFINLRDTAYNANAFTMLDMFKEIFYGLLIAVFFKLGNMAYNLIPALKESSSKKVKVIEVIVNGVFMLFLMITTVITATYIADTVFYHLPDSSYIILIIITSTILIGLSLAAIYFRNKLGMAKSGGFIQAIFEIVFMIFCVILVYFVVATCLELTYTKRGTAAYIGLTILLILGIGIITSVFVYLTASTSKFFVNLSDFLNKKRK